MHTKIGQTFPTETNGNSTKPLLVADLVTYEPRYSLTDEPDDMGRWARKAIYRGLHIAWISRLESNGVVYSYRPKSLHGIENNNGWTKIESEKDLPKEKGLKCLFLCVHGNTTYISDDVLEDPKWFVNKYNHWRLKDEIKDPIY